MSELSKCETKKYLCAEPRAGFWSELAQAWSAPYSTPNSIMENTDAGIEHVERTGAAGVGNNVDEPSERPPGARRTARSSHSRPRPMSMPPVANPDGSVAQQTQEQGHHAHDARTHSTATTRRGGSRATVRVIGNYSLGKTLGAGSMGKVKLAYHNQTGEKLAIKIVPRPSGSHSNQGNPTASFLARQAAKDASKEIRTVREAALSMILFHPYICGTREIIAQPNYHYIVFEFVNGGQMLDYIISHGRLRERVARKFARQIGSALEYCHKNNVVHRDLKIENILISESGNIKIIDFGLSNLYNPAANLTTFCGSLYFAAPELLNAKAYTGPEVDIWSFGVVLYVLVCGKVPFDDQHMPALHAKIKRGIVDYPTWLSAECKHILSRMLVVVPSQRATLHEVLNHPWMLRGFSGPPDPHLLPREPLKASELDPNVIRGMTGFEFGTPAEIEQKLRNVLETNTYRRMVEIFERKHDIARTNGRPESPSSSHTAINSMGANQMGDSAASKKGSKRFSGFDFYKRRFFSQGNSPPSTPTGRLPMSTTFGPQSTAVMDSSRGSDYIDPTLGFHPLISIYFLVREKIERERVYGPQFASSQISLSPPQPVSSTSRQEAPVSLNVAQSGPVSPPSAYKTSSSSTNNGPAKPAPVSVAPPSASYQKRDLNMPLPGLPAPEPTHQAGPAYESPVPKSPTTSMQPQARTIATDLPVNVQPDKEPKSSTPPSAFMPAPPKAAEKHQHRRSTSLTSRAGLMAGWGVSRTAAPPRTAGPEQTAFDENVEIEPRRSEHQPRESEDGRTSPTSGRESSAGGSTIRRFTTMIGNRFSEEGRKTLGRRGSILRGGLLPPRHSVDVASREAHKPVTPVHKSEEKLAREGPSTPLETTQSVPLTSTQPANNLHRRAATIVDSTSRDSKHTRRGSLSAGFALGGFGATIRRPRTGQTARPSGPAEGGETAEKEQQPRNTDLESEGVLVNGEETRVEAAEDEGSATERDVKPLYLKGLFSVATTTTRPANVIKNDIRNVLDRMQIQYREIKGGFECIHAPSIDLASVQIEGPSRAAGQSSRQEPPSFSNDTSAASTIRRGVVRKASKLSFAAVRKKEKSREQEPSSATPMTPASAVPPSVVVTKGEEKELPSRPSVSAVEPSDQTPVAAAENKLASPSGGSSSFFNVPSPSAQQHPNADAADEATNGTHHAKEPSVGKGSVPPSKIVEESGPVENDLPVELEAASVAVPAEPVITQEPTTPTKASSSTTPTRDKFLPPIPQDFAQVPPTPVAKTNGQRPADDPFEHTGASELVVRFEIMIVKVPLLPLHGIQFRRIGGDGWQYHMLARRVLTQLRL